MIKISKRHQSVIVLISLLLISCMSLMPNVHAAEITARQKGLDMLSDVVGLDLSRYNITIQENSHNPPSLGGILQESVLYKLTSAKSDLKAIYTFTNGNLRGMYLLENKGTPTLTKPVVSDNAVKNAQDFLSTYQAFTAKPIFGELKSTLSNLERCNITKTIENKVFQMTAFDDRTHFKWYYTANGASATYTKAMAMTFRDGLLTSFIDNWDMYDVGSTSVNLSKEEAIAIALDTARNHPWTIQIDEAVFNPEIFNEIRSISWTDLTFDGSLDANKSRSENVLELYPVWRIGIVLNRVFGELYGIEVDIWADTKEVRSVKEEYSQLAAKWFENSTTNDYSSAEAANLSIEQSSINLPNNGISSSSVKSIESTSIASNEIIDTQTLSNRTKLNFSLEIVVPAITLSCAGIFAIGLLKKKNIRESHPLKFRSKRKFGILLAFLLLSIIFLPLIATANATTRGGIIWGARSSGAPNNPYSYSWRKTDWEISRQWEVTSYIASNFFTAANGYSCFSNEGVNKDVILYQAGYMRDNFDYVAVVDWDHGVGGYPGQAPGYPSVPWNEEHYMFEDDWGTTVGSPSYNWNEWSHGVYDIDMYNAFPPAKVHFAFIDACHSANLYRLGQGYTGSGNPLGLPFAFTHRIVSYVPSGYTGTAMSDDGYNRPDAFPQCYIGFPTGSAALGQRIPYNTGPFWYQWIIFFYYFALDFDISVKDALDMACNMQWQCDGFLDSHLYGWPGFTAVWPMDKEYPWGEFEEGPKQQGPHSTLAVYGNGNIHLRNFQPSDMVTWPSVSGPITGDIGVNYAFSAHSIDSHGHNIQYRFDWGDNTYTETGIWNPNGVTEVAYHSWGSQGQYNVRVQARCPYTGWSSWSPPITISIGNYHWLYVDAYDNYWNPVTANVWIDDWVWVGTTPVYVLVAEGSHEITVDQDLGYWYLVGFSDGLGNGDSREIYSDTSITAYYQAIW